ncbi:MAG: [protein-PII] uridylyltransferase [Rubripirellula sp.]|nr:[protein-PII] uridylyltransferase [Rubripirellula sp.]
MRSIVLHCRELIQQGRLKAFESHVAGTPAMQVSTLLADVYDDLVLAIWNSAIDEHSNGQQAVGLSLVAHGGFGRRDLAPYSDADLMILTSRAGESLANKVAGNLTRDLADAGITPGLSIRLPDEACRMSWSDPVVYSSLAESRLLAGSLKLYSRYFYQFSRGANRRAKRLIREVVQARVDERRKWGETIYLLRPNVKRSRGALRDIQLIRWLGFARTGETDLERLVKLGVLSEEDFRSVRAAYAFLLRLRNELHFREKKNQDVLDRAMQMEIAKDWGYEGEDGLLPVEQFMQDYFAHTRNVRYSSKFFVDDAITRPMIASTYEWIRSKKLDESILMGPTHIWVRKERLKEFSQSLPDVLRLMGLANQYGKRISHATWQAIRLAMQDREVTDPDSLAIDEFLNLLGSSGRLAPLLRRLHELKILEQLIPEFKRMRGLLQFNAYHKYTVDAHSLRAVEAVTDLCDQEGGMGRRYRRITNKRVLHLALLIHDIGKGYEEDHCIVGARIAKQTAKRLRLNDEDAETLEWLVLKHLAVNVIAFRHDLTDPEIVLAFASEVGSIRRLELLVVHTYADLVAVGPGVATDWKINLIDDLYRRTRRYFDSGNLPGSPDDPELESGRRAVRTELQKRVAPQDSFVLLNNLPLSLLDRCDANCLADEIEMFREVSAGEKKTLCTSHYDHELQATRFTVIKQETSHSIGTFARATGALSTCGLSILRARIETVGDVAWDYFWVVDSSNADGKISDRDTQKISESVCQLLESPNEPLPPYRRKWAMQGDCEPESVNLLPTRVVIDNDTVDRYTILSYFAYDSVGLLYRIAAALSERQVVLHFAKIDTHLDQVADVFYVTEKDGSKLLDDARKFEIREALLQISRPRQ